MNDEGSVFEDQIHGSHKPIKHSDQSSTIGTRFIQMFNKQGDDFSHRDYAVSFTDIASFHCSEQYPLQNEKIKQRSNKDGCHVHHLCL